MVVSAMDNVVHIYVHVFSSKFPRQNVKSFPEIDDIVEIFCHPGRHVFVRKRLYSQTPSRYRFLPDFLVFLDRPFLGDFFRFDADLPLFALGDFRTDRRGERRGTDRDDRNDREEDRRTMGWTISMTTPWGRSDFSITGTCTPS